MNKLLGRWAAELQACKMGRRLLPPPPLVKEGLVLLFPTCCEHPEAEHAEADGTSHLSFVQPCCARGVWGSAVLPSPCPSRGCDGFQGPPARAAASAFVPEPSRGQQSVSVCQRSPLAVAELALLGGGPKIVPWDPALLSPEHGKLSWRLLPAGM